MGMAAGQARLLFIEQENLNNVFKAQCIMNDILALATQKDAIYSEYCAALDKTGIKVAYNNGMGGTSFVTANFSTLCEYNENRMMQYALRNNDTGKVIVSDEVKEIYDEYSNDKYAFAYAMLGFEEPEAAEIGINSSDSSDSVYMTDFEENVYKSRKDSDPKLETLYNKILESEDNDKTRALEDFRDYLYSKYDSSIYNAMNFKQGDPSSLLLNTTVYNSANSTNKQFKANSSETWDDIKGEFNYYVNLFNAIKESGGCQAIDQEYASGNDGSDWLNNMVSSGLVSILEWNGINDKNKWSEATVATSFNNNYLQESQADEDLKKAEIKFKHDTEIVEKNESQKQQELAKLETRKKSNDKMYEAIKELMKYHIDKTFNIFT